MNTSPVALITSRPDVEIAKDLKAELEAKLNELCVLIDKTNQTGFEVSLSIGKRWDGKNLIQQLIIAKHF
jgi:hypothetical protein